MAEVGGAQLAPHYYRDNFLSLCDTVEKQYADLLRAPEQMLLQRLRALDFTAQCLYVRLVSRVGPWFRESKLDYPELGELGPALDQMIRQDMAQAAEDLSPQELGQLYTRAELLQVFGPLLPAPLLATKAALVAAIGELGLGGQALLRLLAGLDATRVIAPCQVEQVQLLQLLFFGNRHQSLIDFVLSDLGVARYHPYELDRAHRLFTDRAALDEYLRCAELSDAWYLLAEEESGDDDIQTLAARMLDTEVLFPSSVARWYRLCNSVARELEREGEFDTATALYERSRRHPARERRARLLERAGDLSGCLSLCEEIIADPWCEQEAEAAGRIQPRVRRKRDGDAGPRRRDNFVQTRLQLERGEQSVELLTATHLAAHWQLVSYVENTLMNALFGLAFWEQIFAAVPGAFHNPYQSVPADMYESGFSRVRRQALDERLAQLREHDAGALLREAFARYRGFQCRWVDWSRLDEQLLATASRVIPGPHLLAIWERMLFDPGENRRGFPDLIALGDTPGEYLMIEVKGPGDALQDSQKRWLRFFMARDIPAQVAWVSWLDD